MMPIVYDVGRGSTLVVGSRPGALDKARIAASFGARVTLVDATISPTFLERARRLGVAAEPSPLTPDHLEARIAASILVFCDTGDDEVDRTVARLARIHGVPINVVDKTDLCTFLMPAYVRGRFFALAITTFGASPMASRYLRERLDGSLPWFDAFIELQAELRLELRERGATMDTRKDLLHRVACDQAVHDALGRNDMAAARTRARAVLEAAA